MQRQTLADKQGRVEMGDADKPRSSLSRWYAGGALKVRICVREESESKSKALSKDCTGRKWRAAGEQDSTAKLV